MTDKLNPCSECGETPHHFRGVNLIYIAQCVTDNKCVASHDKIDCIDRWNAANPLPAEPDGSVLPPNKYLEMLKDMEKRPTRPRSEQRCENCYYWEHIRTEYWVKSDVTCQIGFCQIRSTSDDELPEREEDEWCGEWRTKEE